MGIGRGQEKKRLHTITGHQVLLSHINWLLLWQIAITLHVTSQPTLTRTNQQWDYAVNGEFSAECVSHNFIFWNSQLSVWGNCVLSRARSLLLNFKLRNVMNWLILPISNLGLTDYSGPVIIQSIQVSSVSSIESSVLLPSQHYNKLIIMIFVKPNVLRIN